MDRGDKKEYLKSERRRRAGLSEEGIWTGGESVREKVLCLVREKGQREERSGRG